MLFENVNQFQAAKRTLLENDRNVPYTVQVLKNSQLNVQINPIHISCRPGI